MSANINIGFFHPFRMSLSISTKQTILFVLLNQKLEVEYWMKYVDMKIDIMQF